MEHLKNQTAIFAGGCFWCTEHDFDHVEGVVSTLSGYTGGSKINPTYEEVCSGETGHVEALQIVFDPTKVSYEQLLHVYFKSIDPTRNDGQFCDIGTQYRPVIFYVNDTQKELAERVMRNLVDSKKITPFLVAILPATTFYPAEEYHQKFYQKNPAHYKSYRAASGRDPTCST